MTALIAGGVLAVQMPDNLDEPSHRLMQEVAEQARGQRNLPLRRARRLISVALLRRAEIALPHRYLAHDLQSSAQELGPSSTCCRRPGFGPISIRSMMPSARCSWPTMGPGFHGLSARGDGTVLLRFPRLFMVAVRE